MNLHNTVGISLLALLYVVTAQAGQLFAIGPGNVTPVWLPSGIIFFTIFWQGYRLLPGVFLGALLGNVWAYISFESVDLFITTLAAGLLNGIGDTLCAFIGVYFVKRVTTMENFFTSMRAYKTFVLYAVLMGPFISALFGVGGLWLSAVIPSQEFLQLFITWSIGDSVGVLLVAPLLIALKNKKWSVTLNLKHILAMATIGLIAFSLSLLQPFGYLDVLHIIIILLPILLYFAFTYSEQLALFYAFVASILILFLTPLYKFEILNEVLLSLQMFIFLLFGILLFTIVLINRSKQLEAEQRRQQEKLIQQSRMALLGQMIGVIAHQLKQPLNTISILSQEIERSLDDKQSNTIFTPTQIQEGILSQIEHMNNTIVGFRNFYKPSTQ